MALLLWDNTFPTNIPQIDEQHRKLVDLLNSLHDAMMSGHGKEVLDKTFQELIKYTIFHFQFEEKLLKMDMNPGFMNHLKEHNKFSKKAIEMQDRFIRGDFLITTELLLFLKNWLIHHIKISDKVLKEPETAN